MLKPKDESQSFNFDTYQVTIFKEPNGTFSVRVFDWEHGATWLETDNVSEEEALQAVKFFFETEAINMLQNQDKRNTMN